MMLYLEGIRPLRSSTLGMHGLFIQLTVLPLEVPPHCVQKMVLSHLRREWERCMPCHGWPSGTLMHRRSRLYMKTGIVPDAIMANRTANAASFAAAAVRSDCTFFLNFLRAVAWASVRFGVPSHPIGRESLPVRSEVL